MTEDAWLRLTRPQRMLRHVASVATERRLRLLAVACQRWSYPYEGGQAEALLEAVERVADGIETTDDIATLQTIRRWERRSWNTRGEQAVTVDGIGRELPSHRSNLDERMTQCRMIRDIFGSPFRPATFNPAWLTSTVVALARGIYEERAFDRLPILADALQDAGCEDADILTHCRGDGPHVRGCWVVDLVLGKT